MSISFACEPFSIIRGNASEVLKQLHTKVHCVITSPAYYKQRNYGTSASELGREPSVAEYIGNLVEVFRATPLEPWGSIWVNIGDKRGKQGELLGIPERFVTAMCDAGFYRIDNVIWAKESVRIDGTSIGQAMIEPAARRLNGNGHEPFYRFVLDPKQAWSDTCAVRIPRRNVNDVRYLPEKLMRCHTSLEGRNLGNAWNIPTKNITVTLWLQPHNRALLDRLAEQLCDKPSPNYRHWLKPAELKAQFAPTDEEVKTVKQFLLDHNLRFSRVGPANFSVTAKGTVAEVEDAFSTWFLAGGVLLG
jgi:hypothetical protein